MILMTLYLINFGVAETKYEFKCRDVPWNVSTGVLTSSQIVFILQISNAEIVYDKSSLPARPDLEQINDLCMELVEMQGWG